MALSPESKARLSRFSGRALARYITLVQRTSTVVCEPAGLLPHMLANHPLILACWHGQFMMLSSFRPDGVEVRAMVARHGDAELIGQAMQHLGVQLIRGAGAGGRRKDRGGALALRQSIAALNDGASVVMTADVPPGPARHAGSGIVTLARLSGRPILPVAAATSRYKSFNTWSRFTLNLPYSKLALVAGNPIFVPADADAAALERKRQEVEHALDAATQRAYQMAGADPVRATPSRALDASTPPAEPGWQLAVYRGISRAMRLASPALLGIRAWQGKEDPLRRGERLGHASAARPAGRLVWIHAASVGETNAVVPLIGALGDARPDLNFLLTTGTVTSAGVAERRLGRRGLHQFIPLDSPAYVVRFLDHWQPDLAVFTESEIWPNLILEADRRGIPLTLVNGRLSQRSYGRWRRRPGLSAPLFNRFDLILAQNEKLARWFSDVGARNVHAVGNLKIDSPPPPIDRVALARLQTATAGRMVFVAASTHEGEELIVASAHRRLAHAIAGFCTIIVPRHPERGTAIAELLKSQGFSVAQRSSGALPEPRCDIYIADTIGELGTFYALTDVAFIGGSLVDKGGQNPIEAVRHGAAVLTGPHFQNFRDAYAALGRHNAVIEAATAEALALNIAKLLASPDELDRMREGAEAALATLGGALQRTTDALLAFLPDHEELRRAS